MGWDCSKGNGSNTFGFYVTVHGPVLALSCHL